LAPKVDEDDEYDDDDDLASTLDVNFQKLLEEYGWN
jgi:hypothetical protein